MPAIPNTSAAQLAVPVSSRDHVRGAPDAPITVVEYGDYECPHCGRAHPAVEELLDKYAGKLRFIFRHFPLVKMHREAKLAAEAAEAAAAVGGDEKFWAIHNLLFTHQSQLTPPDLARYAGELGLDVVRFEQELVNHVHGPRVMEDLAGGIRSGVNGTPAFFINGRRYAGPKDVPGFTSAIDEALTSQTNT